MQRALLSASPAAAGLPAAGIMRLLAATSSRRRGKLIVISAQHPKHKCGALGVLRATQCATKTKF